MLSMRYKGETFHVLNENEANNLLASGERKGGDYEPRGYYITREMDPCVAIDNSTGDAWTEEFCNLKCALEWLL